MGLIILTLIGAVLGWLATIILRIEGAREILQNVVAGVAGSLLVGIIAGSGVIFGGVSGLTLLWATAGAVAVIVGLNLIRKQSFG